MRHGLGVGDAASRDPAVLARTPLTDGVGAPRSGDGMTGAAGGPARYNRVAVLLHWAIAALILFNLAFGYVMEGFAAPWRGIAVRLHVSAGITVLALTVVRVAWRWHHRPPPLLPAARWEHRAAHLVHLLLYVGMVAMPLTGWAIISAHPPAAAAGRSAPPRPPTLVWGLVPLPRLAPVEAIGATPAGAARQEVLHDDLVDWHGIGGFVMIALLLLHVGGALKHQWLDGQAELARMGLGGRRDRARSGRP